MTDTTEQTPASRKPKYHAYYVVGAKGSDKGQWNKIGAFFAHEDGNGGTLVLESLPVLFDGRIVLRSPKPKEAAQ